MNRAETIQVTALEIGAEVLYERLRECDHARELLGSHIANCRAFGLEPDPDVVTAYDVLQASVGARP